MVKALVILLLALGIFGSAYYATYLLYLKPQADIRREREEPPPPPPPDPALPEFHRTEQIQDGGDILATKAAWEDFIARYPKSSKADEAKDRLGQINISLFLSPVQTPEKTVYIVKPGDVITRVAAKLQSTPELVMRSNNLQGSMLRIGQRLIIAPADFTLAISRKDRKVVLLQQGKFFKHYPILAMPAHHQAAADKKPAKPQKITGRVTEKIAWKGGTRITFTDKSYADADFWIQISPGGHNLYTEPGAEPGSDPAHKPPGGGYSLARESLQEMAALLRKGDEVTIE